MKFEQIKQIQEGICYKIIIDLKLSMSFYEREERAISQDQQDNLIIQQLTKNYKQLQDKYQQLQFQNNINLKQIELLTETNTKLVKEIQQMKQSQSKQQNNLTHNYFYTGKTENQFVLPPTILNKTIERTIHAQQTKRRVINGFVEQLTQQLQQSEDLLRKERIMQDQTRRTLLVCNQQLLSFKVTVKGLQNQIKMLSLQNQQLFRELQTSIHQKRVLQQKLSTKTIQCNKLKGVFMVNVEQFESEMIKMDSIYKNIESQLENMQ